MDSDTVRVRFAPSPTGYFHLGGARTALYDWLFARQKGGKLILRIEDTDRSRYQPDALKDLLDGMRWLGLCWDEGPEVGGDYGPYYQSDRVELYQKYAEQLIDAGHAYRCYCSADRLAHLREEQRERGVKPGYDGHCRHLTEAQIADYEAQGIKPVVRLATPTDGETEFEDLLRGHISVKNRELDDMVLLKSDGFPTYHLANVVDDHLMEISHILRGEEWLSSVPKHVLLYRAFGWEMPIQVHLPTILDPSGKGKLSKRKKRGPNGEDNLIYIHEFREAGYLPEAMINFMALLGWAYDGQTEFFSRNALIEHFDLGSVSRSPSAFSYDKLEHMNATYIRDLGTNDLAGRLLRELRAEGLPADFERVLALTPLIQTRIRTLADAKDLIDFVFVRQIEHDAQMLLQKKMTTQEARQVLKNSLVALEALDRFETDTIEDTLRELCDEAEAQPREFFGCLRVATTGRKVSPPLFGTLAVLGQERVAERLRGALEVLSDR